MSAAPPIDSPPDQLIRTLSLSGSLAVRALVATRLCADAALRHATSPTASAALGRTLMGALLFATGVKRETVQIEVRGDGPLGSIFAIADPGGSVRGYVSRPSAEPAREDGRIDVAAGVGRGTLSVVRFADDGGQPYTGIVQLQTGSIGVDLAHYLEESEQIRSAVGVGVYLGAAGEIVAAGGYLVQALPGADEDEIAEAEANVRALPGPGELVRAGWDAEAIALALLGALGCRERHACLPAFRCGCERERVLRAVALLGAEELARTAREGEALEVCCRFCAKRYTVEPAELERLLEAS